MRWDVETLDIDMRRHGTRGKRGKRTQDRGLKDKKVKEGSRVRGKGVKRY